MDHFSIPPPMQVYDLQWVVFVNIISENWEPSEHDPEMSDLETVNLCANLSSTTLKSQISDQNPLLIMFLKIIYWWFIVFVFQNCELIFSEMKCLFLIRSFPVSFVSNLIPGQYPPPPQHYKYIWWKYWWIIVAEQFWNKPAGSKRPKNMKSPNFNSLSIF